MGYESDNLFYLSSEKAEVYSKLLQILVSYICTSFFFISVPSYNFSAFFMSKFYYCTIKRKIKNMNLKLYTFSIRFIRKITLIRHTYITHRDFRSRRKLSVAKMYVTKTA